MKSLFVKSVIAMTALFGFSFLQAAQVMQGLVLYTEPPNTYVNVLEFSSLTNTSSVFATAVSIHGGRQEIPRAGIIAIINSPLASTGSGLARDPAIALRSIREFAIRYPQYAAKFAAIEEQWTNSLKNRQLRVAERQNETTAAPPTVTIAVRGIAYSAATLKNFDGQFVEIDHSSGVARIDASWLQPEQVDALNRTSKTIRIDFKKIAAPTAIDPPTQQSVLNTSPQAGLGRAAENGPQATADASPALGDPPATFIARYGKPNDQRKVEVPNTYADSQLTMEKNGFMIRTLFKNQHATGIIFSPTEGRLTPDEVDIILAKHAQGQKWLRNPDRFTAENLALMRSDGKAYAYVKRYADPLSPFPDEVGICCKEQADLFASDNAARVQEEADMQRQAQEEEKRLRETLKARASGL